MKPSTYQAFKSFSELARLHLGDRDILSEKPTSPERLPENLTDDQLFEFSTRDVIPLGWSENTSRGKKIYDIRDTLDSQDEGLRLLQDVVSGKGSLDLTASGEYVEGIAAPEGRRWISSLRRGEFSIQAHLDLHGLNVVEARKAFDEFIQRNLSKGHSCVRIIHGRGKHSQGGKSTLKEQLTKWLGTRRMSRYVIAYTSACLSDGGGGALYILFRRS